MYRVELVYNCSVKSVSFFYDEEYADVFCKSHPNAMFRKIDKVSFWYYLKNVLKGC